MRCFHNNNIKLLIGVDLKVSENIILFVEAARSGDTDAMAKLYSKTLKAAYFLADTLSAGDGSAMDITKKAYAKAFCSVDKLKRPEAFEIWMKQNVAAVFKEGKKFVFADADAGASESSSEFLSEEIFEDEEKSAAVIKAVAGLKTELRTAVVLHYYNGMPVAALAKFLGVSESTANALLGKARAEIVSAADVEVSGESNGSLPVLTKILQRAASAATIDNANVRDIFIYAIDAYEASKPVVTVQDETPVKEEEMPAEEAVAESAPEEKPEPETPAASPADNVISFKQKINEILDKENVPSSEEQSEAQVDEAEESENLDIPAFVSTEPSEEAERAVEQFSEYEKREKPVNSGSKKKINLNKKTIGIVCACLIALVVICVGISKIAGGNKPDVPSKNDGSSGAVNAISAGYEWKAGGFAECGEIEYLDENCAKFKSASTGKYGLLDYQGNIILQPYYDGFIRCSYGRDYSNRGSYHSLVQIGSEFYEFTVNNGEASISETPHVAHIPEEDEMGDTAYDERDRYFEGYAAARKDGLWGYVSQEKDKKVIPYEYEAVNDLQASAAAASDYCRPVTGGLIAVKKDGMMGIIDLENEIVVPFEYTSIMPGSGGVFIACKGGTWGVILVGDAVASFKGVSISVDPDATVPSNGETTTSSSANNLGSYTVISETGANVRDDAGAEFNKIGELDYGDTVVAYDTKTAKDTGKKWIKIKYNGQYGWVAMSNVEEEGA